MWLKHTLSTQPRHLKARQPRLIVWGRHFRLSQPLLCTRHKACVLYWAGLGPQVPYALPLHSPQPHLSTDMPGQDPPPGHTGTRRDMQHCGMEQGGTRHGRAGALTLELAAASNQGQVCSSTQALMRQGRGEGTRAGTSLFFWSYSEGSGPQAEGPDVGTWGKFLWKQWNGTAAPQL